MKINWKYFLTRKKTTLERVIEVESFNSYEALVKKFNKLNLTLPNKDEFDLALSNITSTKVQEAKVEQSPAEEAKVEEVKPQDNEPLTKTKPTTRKRRQTKGVAKRQIKKNEK